MSPAGRRRGQLIVLEGIDGAGKSTLQRELARRFRARGRRVLLLREPADLELGAEAQRQAARNPLAGALYFSLDRARARPRVERALARGTVVLQDRSYYSTLAYQGSALSTPERLALFLLQRHLTVEPDEVLWLDIPPAEALRRVGRRGTRRSPLERRRTLERVRAAYRAMSREASWHRLDATRSVAAIADAAERVLGAGRPARARRRARRT